MNRRSELLVPLRLRSPQRVDGRDNFTSTLIAFLVGFVFGLPAGAVLLVIFS